MASVAFLLLFLSSSALAGFLSIDEISKGIMGKATGAVENVDESKFLFKLI